MLKADEIRNDDDPRSDQLVSALHPYRKGFVKR